MSVHTFTEQSAAPSTPASQKVKFYFDNSTPPRLMANDDQGVPYHLGVLSTNASTAAVAAGYATDTYLAGSAITIQTAGAWRVKQIYRCRFDMVKTNVGTAAFTVIVRMGTAGTTADTAILTLAFAVGTGAIDSGWFDLTIVFRTVGSGTSAVIAGVIKCSHHLAATGLITTGASGFGQILGTSAGFNSSTPTVIGISVNGGASFSGTNTVVESELIG